MEKNQKPLHTYKKTDFDCIIENIDFLTTNEMAKDPIVTDASIRWLRAELMEVTAKITAVMSLSQVHTVDYSQQPFVVIAKVGRLRKAVPVDYIQECLKQLDKYQSWLIALVNFNVE